MLMGAKYAPCMRTDDRIKSEVLDPLRERETVGLLEQFSMAEQLC